MSKLVNLRGPAIINDVLRYPSESPLMVDDKVADHLEEVGMLVVDQEDSDGLDQKNLTELRKIVEEEGIDLKGVTKKEEIIAAIRAHDAHAAE